MTKHSGVNEKTGRPLKRPGMAPGGLLRYNFSKVVSAFFCATLLTVAPAQTKAQTAADADRAQLLQNQIQPPVGTLPEGVENGHAALSPNDADLGEQAILKRSEAYQPFTILVNTPFFYTSNVALTPHHELSDFVVAPAVGIFYEPRITKTLSGFVDVREQIFYYGKYDSFNFASMDVEAGLSYVVPQAHNLVLRAEYDFNRLTDDDLDSAFFDNHQIIVSGEVPFRINRAETLSLGADVNWSVGADHQSPRRNDYEAYASYFANITRAFSLNAVGRVVLRQYHQNDRDDLSEIFSLNASYRLASWCSISAITSIARSDSNQDQFDYNVANAGGALSLTVKF